MAFNHYTSYDNNVVFETDIETSAIYYGYDYDYHHFKENYNIDPQSYKLLLKKLYIISIIFIFLKYIERLLLFYILEPLICKIKYKKQTQNKTL
jgi:hypothetical protein